MKSLKFYLWLCSVNLFISAFTFGGGYVVVPMVRKYYVEQKHVFSNEELMEMAAVAQSSPGAIAINLSILAGKKAGGTLGAILSVICSILPPLVILGFISSWYEAFAANQMIMAILKGMQACVTALIVDVVIDMYQLLRKEKSKLLNLLVPIAFIANVFFNVNIIFILVFGAVMCLLQVRYQQTKEAK